MFDLGSLRSRSFHPGQRCSCRSRARRSSAAAARRSSAAAGRRPAAHGRGARGPGVSASARRAAALVLALAVSPSAIGAQVPTPESVIGWEPGADYKLADYDQIQAYFRALDEASDRVRVETIGETAEGRPMILALISSAENLQRSERYRAIARRLATAEAEDGSRLGEAEARRLARDGKAVVWIDGGLHATEVAGAQFPPALAYRLATEESEEMRRIRERTIILLVPVMNPDGLDLVATWYRRNLGTAFETAPLPELYQKYVGHDNNRDFYMVLQPETRAITRQLWHVWYPQIVVNHHQTSPFPGRIFIPPFADPVNPRIPPLVVTGTNLVGIAMHKRFTEEGKPGAVSRISFTQWWNGGMRTAPYFHNQVGILTEVALHRYATPREYPPDSLPKRFRNGLAADRPSVFYPDPWRGGWWRLRDAVDYMVTASMAVADIAARLKEDWLLNAWRSADRAIGGADGERAEEQAEAGPFAYVVDLAAQRDPGEAVAMLEVLRRGGIELHRAEAPFRAGGRRYPGGSYVVYAAQPFRPYLMDLMEPQAYPDRRVYPGGPPDPPYDLAGWTLPLSMGVGVDRVTEPFEARTAAVEETELPPPAGAVRGEGPAYLTSSAANGAFRAVNALLAETGSGASVARLPAAIRAAGREWPAGSWVVRAERSTLERLAVRHGLEIVGVGERLPGEPVSVRRPRVGLYKSWVANMDEGWSRWVLEMYGFAYESLTDRDLRAGDLSRFDAIVLADQSPRSILHGHRPGTMPPEYTGGIGLEGTLALKRFVEAGGLLLAFDEAGNLAIEQFGLPVRDAVGGLDADRFFIPGSLLRIAVDTTDPIAYGMAEEGAAFFVRSRAYRVPDPSDAEPGATGSDGEERPSAAVAPPDVVARYAEEDLLLSGWELGAARHLGGRPAAVRVPLGAGHVVLIGFRPQFRGQPRGTFKLLFNALYAATMERLPDGAPAAE